MRVAISLLVLLFGCFAGKAGLDGGEHPLTAAQRSEVARNLGAYERGAMSYDQLSAKNLCKELIQYYSEMHGSVSTKAKLPISSCMGKSGNFVLASQLAGEYLQVYSNDWHGWTIEGSALAELGQADDSIRAYTKAVSLGGISVSEALAGTAFSAGRMDVVARAVPSLLSLKAARKYGAEHRENALTILLAYSMRTTNDLLFLDAIRGVQPVEVVTNEILREDVSSCDLLFRLSLPAEKACWKLNSQIEKWKASARKQRGGILAPSRSSRSVALETLTTSPAAAGTGPSGRFVTSVSLPAKEFGFLEATQINLTVRWYVPPIGADTSEMSEANERWRERREAARTSLSHGDTNGALRALEEAIAAGDRESCQALAGLSFASGQFEPVEKLVSKLLARMSAKNTSEQERLCVASILLCYSALAENARLHARIVNGMEPAEVRENRWLASDMLAGFRLFAASWRVEKSILVLNLKFQKWKAAHPEPRPGNTSSWIL